MLRTSTIAALTAALVTGLTLPMLPASAAETTGSISGVAFEDSNRNGVRDSGEAALADQLIYAYEVDGSTSAQARTGADGRYTIAGLPTAAYLVTYSGLSWSPLKDDWVPTTTGGVKPQVTVTVGASPVVVDFGWRRIVRSTTLGSPVSRYTSPAGLNVESYNDAVTAQEVYAALAQGSLGEEQPYVLVRFDYGPSSYCSISSQRSNDVISNYRAACFNNWSTWIDQGDWGVSHEYGHAWSSYRDLILQQDGGFTSYLRARGLEGDTRVGSSYLWDPAELVAEDYRQLLGSPSAQVVQQANRDLPPAGEVPGLKEFLLGTYSQPAATAAEPSEPAEPALSVSGVAMSPTVVTKSGTASATLSKAAVVTMHVLDQHGAVVRTLHDGPAAGGALSVTWDRKASDGRRAPAGRYTLHVAASTSAETAAGTAAFQVK